jgi:hypothetical protein
LGGNSFGLKNDFKHDAGAIIFPENNDSFDIISVIGFKFIKGDEIERIVDNL